MAENEKNLSHGDYTKISTVYINAKNINRWIKIQNANFGRFVSRNYHYFAGFSSLFWDSVKSSV